MTLRDLVRYLESIAPLRLQESYDNSGLIVGELSAKINAVLTTLDATEAVVDEAIQRECNIIVAHHPIIFSGLKKINKQHYIGRAVVKAIKNDIAIYAMHTNLDHVLQDGVNGKIADQIGLLARQILVPKEVQQPEVGSGLLGELEVAMTFDAFLAHLKTTMDLQVVKHTPYVTNLVRKVALCGGSGRFLLENAIEAGADVFISADFKYHDYFEANEKICIMDIGHYESERFTKNLLQELIQRKFSNFAAYCSEVNTNPINYK